MQGSLVPGLAPRLTNADLPRAELPLALVGFKLGVEVGQVGFVLLVVLIERPLRRLEIRWPGWAEMLPGYVVGSRVRAGRSSEWRS